MTQAHVIIGCEGLSATDPAGPTMSVLLSVLGGSMSSRLFQEVREKRGLAYTTYAFDVAYSDTGTFGMYAGCSPTRSVRSRPSCALSWKTSPRTARPRKR